MVNWMINLDGSTRSRNIELRLVERIALRTTTKKLAENLFFPLLSFSLFHSKFININPRKLYVFERMD